MFSTFCSFAAGRGPQRAFPQQPTASIPGGGRREGGRGRPSPGGRRSAPRHLLAAAAPAPVGAHGGSQLTDVQGATGNGKSSGRGAAGPRLLALPAPGAGKPSGLRSSSPNSPRSPIFTSYWASGEKPRSAAHRSPPLPGVGMQRAGPPGEAALSLGRGSLGPEATGSKSSPSCKAECLDRASGGCRLRQAAGLLRCRSPGRGGGCAAPAPAVYFPLRSQSARLRSRSSARLHRMVLAASPVWQSATTTSRAKDLVGVFFCFSL